MPVMGLFILAFVLRALGADYGYLHGDEPIGAAARVLTGELVPEQHFYPPLVNYLTAIGFAGLYLLGLVLSWWDGTDGFRAQYFADPTVFYVTARLMTAAVGALSAPLAHAIARRLGLSQGLAMAAGLILALYPLGVYMAHISKGDVALATAGLAVIWALLARLDQGRPGWGDVVLALCVVLALSFKHSILFILAPLAFGTAVLVARAEGPVSMLRSLALVLVTGAIIWPVLNIGIVLDFENFLAFQQIQAVMSLRMEEGVIAGLTMLARRGIDMVLGLNPVLAVAALITPLMLASRDCSLRHKPALILVWLSIVVGTLAVAAMSGSRQPEHLWIANFAGLALLAALALAGLVQGGERALRLGAGGVLVVGAALFAIGAAEPLRQAMAEPQRLRTDAYIAEHLAEDRILTMVDIGLPQRREAQSMQLARWQRLAERYDVEMPQMAEERIIRENAPGAVFYMAMPTVMYGLESTDEEAVDYEVHPHAWPPQREEWQLDYWIDLGFTAFVVSNLGYHLNEIDSALMRNFFADLVERCEMEARFDPAKPLFLEREVSIFLCPTGA